MDNMGAMTFREWLAQQRALGRSERDIASALGLRVLAMQRYAKGDRFPRPAVLEQIWQATGGAVEPNSWYRRPASPRPVGDGLARDAARAA